MSGIAHALADKVQVGDAPAPSIRRAALPLALLSLTLAAGFTALGSFATVQEGVKAELGIGDGSLALIGGLGAAVPLALFSIPIGLLVDRYNRVRLLIALAACWTLGTLLTAYAGSTATLILTRMLTGIGATGALTAALSIGADLCAPTERGRAMLAMTLGKTLGLAAAFALVGWLYGLFPNGGFGLTGWRAAHLALASLCLVCLLPLLLLREPARHEVAAGPGAPFAVLAGELWARRAFLLPLFVGQISVVMADNASLSWSAPVLQRVWALRPEQFAGWMGALLLATGLGGAVLGGLAADRGQRSGRRGGVLLGALAGAVVGLPAAIFPIAGSVPAFAALLGVLVLCGTVTGLITSVALTVLLPNEVRGFAIGLFIAVAGVIGFGVAPALVVGVSRLLGGEGHLAPALAIVGLVTGGLAVLAFAQAIRRAPDPIARD